MFISPYQPVSAIRFGNGTQQNIIQGQHRGSNATARVRSLHQESGLAYPEPLVKILNREETEQLLLDLYATRQKPQVNFDEKVDFDKQAVILVYPDECTSTGMARLVATSARYDEQTGLSLKMQIQYPSGFATADIGSPWALVVVDKKFADKQPTIEMLPRGRW